MPVRPAETSPHLTVGRYNLHSTPETSAEDEESVLRNTCGTGDSPVGSVAWFWNSVQAIRGSSSSDVDSVGASGEQNFERSESHATTQE